MDKHNTTPIHPIISDNPKPVCHCDTLENTVQVLELLEYIDFSEGLTQGAQFGLFLVLEMLIDSINHVNNDLKNQQKV